MDQCGLGVIRINIHIRSQTGDARSGSIPDLIFDSVILVEYRVLVRAASGVK